MALKCKLKCYVKPMKDPLGVSVSKGYQETTRGKVKILLTSMGIEPKAKRIFDRGQKIFFFTWCGSLISFTRANAQSVFHGFHIAP